MATNALIKKLRTLTAVRALFVTVLLGSFFVFEIGYRIFPYPQKVLYLIIALYVLTIAYAILLRNVGTITFAYVQICLDVMSAITLIFLTGGIESWFSFLMILIVISAAIVLDKRAGYIIATLSSVFFGSLIDLQFYEILPIPYDPMLREKDFLYNIFSHIFGLYLTAYLIGYLSSRLERTTIRLERKDIDLRDLTLFNKEVIEAMPSGLFTTDLSGRILLFNRAAENITGIKRGIAIGQNITAILPFIGSMEAKERFEDVLECNGENKVIGLTISKMIDANNEESGFIGIFNNLTELKQMQEEIRQKEKLADIGELAANMAHEIRNPLASLKGSIEMLKEGIISEGHKDRLMEIALSEMNRLNTIITDFLAYSRPKPVELQVFDLNQMLGETLEMLKNRNAENISFRKGFNGQLYIKADPQRLQQVFWNLGINAIEAMPDGGELFISTDADNSMAEIVFEDTGMGISPENMRRVFYPFFTTKEAGTGLGLSIAYRIIHDHNGIITFSSEAGKGTRFRIILPKGDHERGKSQDTGN